MNFLIDAQLPPALARWLREAGHGATHVEGVSLRDADDVVIWAHALQSDTILVTRDEDFVVRSTRETRSPVIVWLRVGNSSNAALRVWIEARMPGIVQMLGLGSRVVEVI